MERTEAVGQVRAKTGTLDGVVALSGYVETAAREHLAFAVLVNDHGGRNGAVTARVDQIAALLAARGRPAGAPAPGAGPAGRTQPPSAAGAAQAVDATVRTYLAMGRAGDPRNVAFLRTALHAEGDPAVRLAVAEALFRSEPDAGSVQRVFLEAVAGAPGAAPLLPLLAAADPADPAPILSALGDLAAGDGREALGLLVGLAAPAAGAPPLQAALAPILADLAEVIPEPMRAAVLGAPPDVRQAATALLADRLPGLAGPPEGPTMGPAPETPPGR